jgi:hypothetical protein
MSETCRHRNNRGSRHGRYWREADILTKQRCRKVPDSDIASDLGFRLAKQRVRCLRSNESYPVKLGHWETAMGIKSYTAAPTAALALGLFFTPPVSIAIDATINTVASLVSPAIGNLSFISPAMGQADAPT